MRASAKGVQAAGLPAGRGGAAPVTKADLARLPGVAQRYLDAMGVVGKPRSWSFRARYTGTGAGRCTANSLAWCPSPSPTPVTESRHASCSTPTDARAASAPPTAGPRSRNAWFGPSGSRQSSGGKRLMGGRFPPAATPDSTRRLLTSARAPHGDEGWAKGLDPKSVDSRPFRGQLVEQPKAFGPGGWDLRPSPKPVCAACLATWGYLACCWCRVGVRVDLQRCCPYE